ncbi:hypothetical protein [Lampropedia aestuarii]|uniref:hypothetical protein n=1 Tax=Lampropedia aestuarii TaxID=2562762 RepID=UPI00246854EE|nr:hypothetical protein [Lampropedia aestuarii]MDH5856265.1 hypothetical protein [Lampropedia aestuarii]
MSTKNSAEKSVNEAAEAVDETIRKTADKGIEKVEKGVEKAADVAQKATGKVLDHAEEAIDKTRKAVDSGLDKVERTVRDLNGHADPKIDEIAHKALDVATQCINVIADSSERTCQRLSDLSQATNRYVVEKPGKSLMIAAATGAVLTALLLGGRRNR